MRAGGASRHAAARRASNKKPIDFALGLLRRIFANRLFLNYMSSRELEQFDKHLKLRCPWILEPNLAGLANAL
jgi:hypothetical protein